MSNKREMICLFVSICFCLRVCFVCVIVVIVVSIA